MKMKNNSGARVRSGGCQGGCEQRIEVIKNANKEVRGVRGVGRVDVNE